MDLGDWVNQTARPTGSLEDDRRRGGLLCEIRIWAGPLRRVLQKVSGPEMVCTALEHFLGPHFLVDS